MASSIFLGTFRNRPFNRWVGFYLLYTSVCNPGNFLTSYCCYSSPPDRDRAGCIRTGGSIPPIWMTFHFCSLWVLFELWFFKSAWWFIRGDVFMSPSVGFTRPVVFTTLPATFLFRPLLQSGREEQMGRSY